MIELNNISVEYGKQRILQGINLRVKEGATVGILGESGCGKTTLLKVIAGFVAPSEGALLIKGREPEREPWLRDIAFVPQEPVLWNHMTVQENILYGARKPGNKETKRKQQEQLQYVCGELGIEALLKRYPHEISGGQAKRASLARALLSERSVLLLDEALTNLDDDTKKMVGAFLTREVLGRHTCIYISHNKEEVAEFCEEIYYMNGGRL